MESHGKHLEIEWDDGVILHTHMRMSGSWHLYRSGESWQRPHHQLRALIEVAGLGGGVLQRPGRRDVPPCPTPAATPGSAGSDPTCAGSTPTSSAASSCCWPTTTPTPAVAEVLLDQRVFCGVGNVYRCEVLWAGELSPFAQVGDLPEPDAVRLVNVAATLLRANLAPRRADHACPACKGGLAVYGRTGQRCRRCSETIEARRGGEHARTLYWCPGCQVPPRSPRTSATTARSTDPHPARASSSSPTCPWRRTG